MIKTVWCITFYVTDLAKAAKFYEETLGLEKKYQYQSYIAFECGGVEIGLTSRKEHKAKVDQASPVIELLVDDVDIVYSKLKKNGVRFIEDLHDEPWGGRQAAFTDLDGNVLEITQVHWEKYFSVAAQGAKEKA
jgi:catechol 2,3-dioxygenase-like lactoylglutathione lyase family enzyme